jgi:hypothetical protein
MPTRISRLSHHPVLPLIALLLANVVFYLAVASVFA